MIMTVILFLVVLSVLVLAHEWGHYAAAKKMGMRVEEFGLGFPPRAWSWKGKDGMRWSLNWVPIGGFVRIKGESGGDRHDKDSFVSKSLPARFFVLIAGVLMNFLLAAALFAGVFFIGTQAITEDGVESYAIVTEEAIRVADVLPDSPAAIAGIEIGDELLLLNGEAYSVGEEARDVLLSATENDILEFVIEREGVEQTFTLAEAYVEELEGSGFGIALLETGHVRYPWYRTPWKGVQVTIGYTIAITLALWDIVVGLVTGAGISADVAGPVGIAAVTGEVAARGITHLLFFAAILSINLAIINVLPFPALDGGRVVFVLLEAVRRKPVSEKLEAVVHNLGFFILIGLIIAVTYRDIVQLF